MLRYAQEGSLARRFSYSRMVWLLPRLHVLNKLRSVPGTCAADELIGTSHSELPMPATPCAGCAAILPDEKSLLLSSRPVQVGTEIGALISRQTVVRVLQSCTMSEERS